MLLNGGARQFRMRQLRIATGSEPGVHRSGRNPAFLYGNPRPISMAIRRPISTVMVTPTSSPRISTTTRVSVLLGDGDGALPRRTSITRSAPSPCKWRLVTSTMTDIPISSRPTKQAIPSASCWVRATARCGPGWKSRSPCPASTQRIQSTPRCQIRRAWPLVTSTATAILDLVTANSGQASVNIVFG